MKTNYQREYEKRFADIVGAPAARATALGRQALALLLKAVGVRGGDRVGVCAFTCLSVLEAVKIVGAKPVYLDVDESLCIDPESILRLEVNSLKVVILQHTFGNPGKLDQLLESSRKINAMVIEDCAHALGCFWRGTPLGRFGEGAIYSFQWGKPYTTGEGGMLTVNSEDLLEKVDSIIKKYATKQSINKSIRYEIQRIIFNALCGTTLDMKLRSVYRFFRDKCGGKPSFGIQKLEFKEGYIRFPDWFTIKAGLREIKKWPDNMKMRRQNSEIIEQHLRENGIKLWPKQNEADVTYLRYPVYVYSKSGILNKAMKSSLDLSGWYHSPVHPLCGRDLNAVDYFPGMATQSEESIERIVHMSTGRGVTAKKLHHIFELLKSDLHNKCENYL